MSDVAHGEDDLTQIKGIGTTYTSKLVREGLTTFGQVAAASTAALHEITRCPVTTIDRERWQIQARDLATGSSGASVQPGARHIFTIRLNISAAGTATYTLEHGHADDGVTTSASEPAQEWNPDRVVAYIEERTKIHAAARESPTTAEGAPTDGDLAPSDPTKQGVSRAPMREALLLIGPQPLPRATHGEVNVDITTKGHLSASATAALSVIVRRPADGQPEPIGHADRQLEPGKPLQARVPCDLGEGGDEGEISALIHLHTVTGDLSDAVRLVADATLTPVH
jgi:hypothetical protein